MGNHSKHLQIFFTKILLHLFVFVHIILTILLFKNVTAIPHGGPSDDTSTQTWDDPQVPFHKERQHVIRCVATTINTDTQFLNRDHREHVVHMQVCALVTYAQTHLSIIRKLYGMSTPVVYSNVNHMTHVTLQLSSIQRIPLMHASAGWRDPNVWPRKSAC